MGGVMRSRYFLPLFAFLSALFAGAPMLFAREATLSNRLDAVINHAIAEKRVVGTVVLVARDGKLVYHRAAGLADRELRKPMRENTIFNFSSVTKPIVSAAAMKLVEQGRIALDDPVTKWLPDFRPKLADGSTPTITIRHLLTHTAGLSYRFYERPDSDYDNLQVSDGFDQPGLGLDENLRRLGATQLRYAPGHGWKYSIALDVLGAVMERTTNTPLPQLVEQLVTGPLSMHDTAFRIVDHARASWYYVDHKPEPARMRADETVPLRDGVLHFAPNRLDNPASYSSGGAGMAGTAHDFLKFLETIRRGGAPILKSQTVAEMMRVQVPPPLQTEPGCGFGFGWSVLVDPSEAKSPQSPSTIAWSGVYGHTWFVDPKQRLTVVVFTNTTLEGLSGAFPNAVRDAVYAAVGRM